MNQERHPKGLYVLFFTEMWERFGFYSMAAMFVLYMRHDKQGFGWTAEEATGLWANYLMFVYAAPLLGGWIADRKLGYRNCVLIGGVVFMVGYFLLSIRELWAVYLALTCLVVGNGFFKPNVSAMVGSLYPEGSKLKDRAYNIFYMGINIGALLAPINAEIWVNKIGFNNAFAIAGFGMIVSVAILWTFKHHVEGARTVPLPERAASANPDVAPPEAAGPEGPTPAPKLNPIDLVPQARRIVALIVIFGIVIVFWMVFHQNGSTLTYWADDNTDWNVTGIIANAINPAWVVILSFPVVWMWGWLNRRNMEPSTPTKMTFGMFLVTASFVILYFAARRGETQEVTSEMLAAGNFRVTDRALENLKKEGLPQEVIDDLNRKDDKGKFVVKGKKFSTDRTFEDALGTIRQTVSHEVQLAKAALRRHRDEDRVLQEAILAEWPAVLRKGALPMEIALEKLQKAKDALEQHRKEAQALRDRLARAEKVSRVLADLKISEGELPPLAERTTGGDPTFAEALEEALKSAGDLSSEDRARVLALSRSTFSGQEKLRATLARPDVLGMEDADKYTPAIEKQAYLFRVSPLWLIIAYAVMTLAELMLSPMGLSLVSKVAPIHLRGLMMGGWFLATAIGNKLTAIGVYWEIWQQSTFFIVLGGMAAAMGFVLVALLRPLKKAMPGV